MRVFAIHLTDDQHAALKFCATRDYMDMNQAILDILDAYLATQQVDFEIAYRLVERDRRHGRRKKKGASVTRIHEGDEE